MMALTLRQRLTILRRVVSVHEYQQALQKAEAELAALKRDRAQLDLQAARLEQIIAGLRTLMEASVKEDGARSTPPPPPAPGFREAVVRALADAQRTIHSPETQEVMAQLRRAARTFYDDCTRAARGVN